MSARYRLRRNWPRGSTTSRAARYGGPGARARKRLVFTARSSLGRGRGYLRRVGFYRGTKSHGCGGKELKFLDQDINDAVIANPSTIAADSVLTIVQGDGESERIGRKVCIKKINWRFQISLAAQADLALGCDTVRVMLYLDQQTNGAAATAAIILANDDFQSFLDLVNKGRFKILMDRTYSMNATAGGGQNAADSSSCFVMDDSFYKKCSIPIEYDNSAGTGAITTMRSNNIGVLLLSQSGRCAFNSQMRIRYTD